MELKVELTINTWHFEDYDCEATFYTYLGGEPSHSDLQWNGMVDSKYK